ncbi:MAG: molecular chaperone HtpG [Chitinispirillaceae bacterium]|nr:molecular chaperone HtpG [Chitinispirillaceae bacterium]
MADTAATGQQKMEFQTEAKQLLHLMVHALYTHKEVFLRELISNASDALDKLRFESLTNPAIKSGSDEPAIHIKIDKTAKTITISDNGIGMTRQEVIDNIGTIARSGSKAFLEKMTGDQKADSNLIGQFGVGFYSVFMVSTSVKLVTKRAGSGEPAAVWESKGESDFSIEEGTREGHGTDVVLYLKEEESTYVEEWQVRSLIKKYSDFIAFPIYLPNDKGKEEVVNQTKPLWCRPAAEVTQEQYKEFYEQVLAGFDEPLSILHNRAEGIMEYSSLLYIPSKSPFDLFSLERKHGVKLYVKRVFIMDNCKELLPEYLRFTRGVVDSEDLPLNISRETLQKNPVIEKIKKTLVGKILGKLKELAENEPDTYKKFWQEFGPVLKEGLHMDYENKEQLLELVRFQSSNGTKDEFTSLKQYVSRMRSDQKDIYYITGESREIVEKSPHLEVFKSKSIEVLFLIDPIDEWVVGDIYNYDGKQLKSVMQGDLDLGDLGKEEEDAKKKSETKFKKLSERIKNILAGRVKEVHITTRLKDSPACLVSEANAMGAHMEKLMKAMGQTVPESKRILEINAEHPILMNMHARYSADPKDPDLEEWVHLLYEQALIAEGQMVPDPMAYSRRVNNLLMKVSAKTGNPGPTDDK